eukprot:1226068-Ditylum_brightwellii.AAC.1
MRILRKFRIPDSTVDVICRMYRDFHLISSVGKASETILYTIGVHQGDNLAPLLFNLFFQAALESLEHFWQTECFPILQFCWFPTCKNGRIKGRLHRQGKAKGKSFGFDKSLYVDDGAFLFNSRADLEQGANLIFPHFKRFGLLMHIGGNDKPPKTEAVIFAQP